MTSSPTRLVAFGDACDRLAVNRKHGYELVRLGKFPVDVIKVGGQYRVREADLDRICSPASA